MWPARRRWPRRWCSSSSSSSSSSPPMSPHWKPRQSTRPHRVHGACHAARAPLVAKHAHVARLILQARQAPSFERRGHGDTKSVNGRPAKRPRSGRTHPCTPTSAREDTYFAVLDRIRLYSCRSYSHGALEDSLHETVFLAPRLVHSARRPRSGARSKSSLDTS